MIKRKVPYPVIVKYLMDKGITLSTQSVSRHKLNHLIGDKKPRQIQKGNVRRAQQHAKGQVRASKKSPSTIIARDQRIIKNTAPVYVRDHDPKRGKLRYEKELKRLKGDVDVFTEMLWIMAVGKDRVVRSLEEEEDTGMVLATTSGAIKDYEKIVKDFHEMTQGMESIQQLRFAQLVQMVGNVFVQQPLTDKARFEMFQLLEDNGVEPAEIAAE